MMNMKNVALKGELMNTAYFPQNISNNKYVDIIKGSISINGIDIEGMVNSKIIKGEYDIVNLNWFESIQAKNKAEGYKIFLKRSLLLTYLKYKKIKIIWTLHNRVPHDGEYTKLSIALMKKMAKVSDVIIIHCSETREVIQKLNPSINVEKIKLIQHPNYIDVYEKKSINYREKYNILENEMVYLFFGQIRPYKNVELIIEAAKESRVSAKFIIAGKACDKEYEKKILNMVGKNNNIIPIFKYISDDEVTSLIDSSDVVILPYDIKSSLNSGAAILAFSLGKTIICPNIGTLKDMNESDLFYSYEYENRQDHLEKLIDSINKSYNEFETNKELFYQNGIKLLNIMEKQYSHKEVSEKYNLVYTSLMEKNK